MKDFAAALAGLVMIAGSAFAQGSAPAPSAEQARQLQQQVRAWLGSVTGNAVALPDDPARFVPDGDGYRISVPLGFVAGLEPKDAAITARAHMIDATRWSIDAEQLPPSLKLTTEQRFPDAGEPSPGQRRGTHVETVTAEVKLGAQTANGVLDPTFATATTTRQTIQSIDIVRTGGPSAGITHIGPVMSTSTISPSGDGRSDVVNDATLETYETKTAIPGRPESITVTIDRLHVVSGVTGVARDRLTPFVALAVASAKASQIEAAVTADVPAATQTPPPSTAPTPAQAVDAAAKLANRARTHALLAAAAGLLTGGKTEQTMDGIRFDVDGHVGGLTHAALTLDAAAPQDTLAAALGVTLDGLTLDQLPPALAAYVPSHFMIRPTVSKLSVAALTRIGMDATGADGKAPDADYAALFENGGIDFGFDALGLDIGPAKFTGTGRFNATGPQTVTGQAEIDAQGLDALITKAQGDPVLARAVPVMIFLKGIAKTNADQSTWLITVARGRTLVNGVDLMALAGAMGR